MCIKTRKYHPLCWTTVENTALALFLSVFLLLIAAPITFSQALQNEVNLLEKGLEEKQKGNYQKTLEIWYEAKETLGEPDFRIAHEYIKLVTEEELKQYYQNATDLYFWGLAGSISSSEQQVLLDEITFLKPLIENRDYRNLKNKIEDANSQALSEIKNYWKNLDTTPLNSYNERLIEHWKRISFALKNYSLPGSDELDDRGFIYIKYGTPYFSKEGQLSYQQSLVHELLRRGIKTPSFGTANDRAVANAQRYNLETRIRQFHSYPNYEVWIYPDLTDNNENTIFIFGSQDGSNKYEKVKSIEDFIPSEAYRNQGQHNYSLSGSRGFGDRNSDESSDVQFDASRESLSNAEQVTINPALILQLMYYQQFSALDRYFGNSFDDMMDQYTNISNSSTSNMSHLAREFGTMYGNELVQRQSIAPTEKSEDKAQILSIPSETYTYRFLDENNEPYVKAYTNVDLEEALYYDLLKETNSLQSEVSNKYTLISGYLLKSNENNTLLEESNRKDIDSADETINIFDIPYEPNSQSVILSHELHKKSQLEDSTISQNTAYPSSLKGLVNETIKLPEPLNFEELALSDLIVGYSRPSEELITADDSLNFNLAHNRTIPEGSDLNLYYEIYNLEPDEEKDISEFTFHYTIRKESKVLGIFERYADDDTGITINHSISDDRFDNALSIKTSTLDEGKYHLEIEVEDQNSDEELSRTLAFKIQ